MKATAQAVTNPTVQVAEINLPATTRNRQALNDSGRAMMTGSFQQPVSANTIEVVEESKDGSSKPPRRNTVTNFA